MLRIRAGLILRFDAPIYPKVPTSDGMRASTALWCRDGGTSGVDNLAVYHGRGVSSHHLETDIGGTCANADCALYHDPDTNPQHEYYPLAAMDLTFITRRNAPCVPPVSESRKVAVPLAVNPLTGARKRYDGAGQEVLE